MAIPDGWIRRLEAPERTKTDPVFQRVRGQAIDELPALVAYVGQPGDYPYHFRKLLVRECRAMYTCGADEGSTEA